MPADGTQIKQDINNDLGNKGYRGVRTFMIIATLIKVVDWITGVVNGNLSTWLRTTDSQPGGANADSVFRTGSTDFRGGVLTRARTPDNSSLANVAHGGAFPLQLIGQNGGPAFVEFHLPGNRIDQLGIDTDGKLKVHPWGTSAAYALVIDMLTASFALTATIGNRKFILYDVNNNDHQFYGLGINGGVLRYQVPDIGSNHIFYAGSSAATSAELMRITGAGRVGINNANPAYRLSAIDSDPSESIIAHFFNSVANGNGARVRMGMKDVGQWDIGMSSGSSNCLVIVGWNGSGMSERVRITPDGRVLIGQTAANDRDTLQVNGSISGKVYKQSGNPSAGDTPVDGFRLIKNTTNGEVRLWVNDGGTMKSVLLS